MPRNEIRMQMRQDHVLDLEPVFAGKRNVLIDVPLRIDNNRRPRLFVANQVGSMRQTRKIKLLEDHWTPPFLQPRHASPRRAACALGVERTSREANAQPSISPIAANLNESFSEAQRICRKVAQPLLAVRNVDPPTKRPRDANDAPRNPV
jgi:hypothetical protein